MNDALAGYLLYTVFDLDAQGGSDRKTFYVHDVSVRSNYRKQGIGRALLDELCKRAEGHAGSVIHATVWKGNDGSNELFERTGFEPMRTEFYRFM